MMEVNGDEEKTPQKMWWLKAWKRAGWGFPEDQPAVLGVQSLSVGMGPGGRLESWVGTLTKTLCPTFQGDTEGLRAESNVSDICVD